MLGQIIPESKPLWHELIQIIFVCRISVKIKCTQKIFDFLIPISVKLFELFKIKTLSL